VTDEQRRKILMALKAMMLGLEIKIGQNLWAMDSMWMFSVIAHDMNGKKHYLHSAMNFEHVLKFLADMTDEEFISIAANIVLNEKGK
jgi:hypothetical protein